MVSVKWKTNLFRRPTLRSLFGLVVASMFASVESNRAMLAEPGDLITLSNTACKGGRWHDFKHGLSYEDGVLIEASPENATEFVCLAEEDAIEKLVLLVKKRNMTFTSSRGEGLLKSENFTLNCSVEVWSNSNDFFHLSISGRSDDDELVNITSIKMESTISQVVDVHVVQKDGDDDDDGGDDDDDGGDDDDDNDGGDDDGLEYFCKWKIQFENGETKLIDMMTLKLNHFKPVDKVQLNSTKVYVNTSTQCTAQGYPAPHKCHCQVINSSNPEILLVNENYITPLHVGSYWLKCLAINSFRGEEFNSTWFGRLEVQPHDASGVMGLLPTSITTVMMMIPFIYFLFLISNFLF